MTEHLAVIVHQIAIFALLMGVGFIAAITGVLTKEALNALSKLVVKIILPALIFSVVAGSGVTSKEFLISGRFAAAVVLCYALLILMANIVSKLCRMEGKTANVFVALASFGNMGFMGIPLIQAIFKEPSAQVCIAVYTLIDMGLLWTYGVYLCSRHESQSNTKSALKNMVNPTTIALVLAFIIMLTKIPIPALVMQTITGIGNTSKYLTLMYLGGSLAFVSVGSIIKKPNLLALVAVKMILLPIAVYPLLSFFLPEIPKTILTLIVGLPSMTTIVMLAAAYDSDSNYATEGIFVTTLASLVTIPVVSVITSMM